MHETYTQRLGRPSPGDPSPSGVLGRCLWVAPDRFSAAETRARLAVEASAVLDPGVRTLQQTADAVLSAADRDARRLSTTQQRRLIAELLAAETRGDLGPLAAVASAPGTVDYVAARIDEQRRTGDAADAAAARLRSEPGEAGPALARLFDRYTRALARHALLDTAGVLDLATRLLGDHPRLRLLVVPWSGQRLTTVEARFLAALAGAADEVLAVRPGGANLTPGAEAAFGDAARESLAWLGKRRGAPGVTIVDDPDRGGSTALAALRRALFDDEPPRRAADASIDVVAGGGPHDELRRVAGRIKAEIAAGRCRPAEIVVAARRWPDRGARIAAVLREHGVPAEIEPRPRLAATPVVTAVRAALRVAMSDWAQEPLLQLLTRGDLDALAGEAGALASERAAAEWFVRDLGAPSGRDYLLHRVAELAAAATGPDASPRLRPIPQATRAVGRVAEALDALPRRATPLAWLDACREALRRLGYRRSPGDDAALGEVESHLAETLRLGAWRGAETPDLSAAAFEELLAEIVDRRPIPTATLTGGRVRVVSAPTAAGLTMRRLYVVDLHEAAFAGDDAAAQAREALLFHELVTRPAERLTLSYAALDESAQLLHPSPLVGEVERLFEPGSLRRDPPPLARRDPGAAPRCGREARNAAAARTVGGDPNALAGVAPAARAALAGGLRAVAARAGGDALGPFEGVFAPDRATAAALGDRFGADHVWSASQLELYATCPFKFFARHVIGVEPPGESALGVDHRRLGLVTHDALADALAPGRGDDALDERLRRAIRSAAAVGAMPRHEAGVASVEAAQAEAWAEAFAEHQAAFAGRWSGLDVPLAPRLLEAKFGPGRRAEGIDPASTDEPLRLELPAGPGVDEGETLLLAGVIDRVDAGSSGGRPVFAVIDYKTGREVRVDAASIRSGHKLQTVLYALAAERLFFGDQGATPVAAGYWSLEGKGFVEARKLPPAELDDGGARPTDAWLETVEAVRRRVAEIVGGVRRGRFEVFNHDKDCGERCDFRTICRVGQARALGKLPPSEDAG